MSNTFLRFTPERMNPSVISRFHNWSRFPVSHGISFSGVAPVQLKFTSFLLIMVRQKTLWYYNLFVSINTWHTSECEEQKDNYENLHLTRSENPREEIRIPQRAQNHRKEWGYSRSDYPAKTRVSTWRVIIFEWGADACMDVRITAIDVRIIMNGRIMLSRGSCKDVRITTRRWWYSRWV